MNSTMYHRLITILEKKIHHVSLNLQLIYTLLKIYDIVLRSEFVFDEYDTSPWTNPSDSQNNSADSSSTKCTS